MDFTILYFGSGISTFIYAEWVSLELRALTQILCIFQGRVSIGNSSTIAMESKTRDGSLMKRAHADCQSLIHLFLFLSNQSSLGQVTIFQCSRV